MSLSSSWATRPICRTSGKSFLHKQPSEARRAAESRAPHALLRTCFQWSMRARWITFGGRLPGATLPVR